MNGAGLCIVLGVKVINKELNITKLKLKNFVELVRHGFGIIEHHNHKYISENLFVI